MVSSDLTTLAQDRVEEGQQVLNRCVAWQHVERVGAIDAAVMFGQYAQCRLHQR